jgi:hypothetical protein
MAATITATIQRIRMKTVSSTVLISYRPAGT